VVAAPPLNHDARDVSRNTPPAKASRISARAIPLNSTDVGIRDLRIIKKQTEALFTNRHAAAQTFLSTWDWPAAYVKHTDLCKPEDRALGRSQGRADRQDPCPDRHRDLPGRDVGCDLGGDLPEPVGTRDTVSPDACVDVELCCDSSG
jgi:hypothetical protein